MRPALNISPAAAAADIPPDTYLVFFSCKRTVFTEFRVSSFFPEIRKKKNKLKTKQLQRTP